MSLCDVVAWIPNKKLGDTLLLLVDLSLNLTMDYVTVNRTTYLHVGYHVMSVVWIC